MKLSSFGRATAAILAALLVSSCSDDTGSTNTARPAAGTPPAAEAPQVAGGETQGFSPAQMETIRQIVRQTLIENPEILVEASAALQEKEQQEQAKQQAESLAQHAETLFRSKLAPVVGNQKGDVTVVEFFDYNCPYCRKAYQDLTTLMDADKNVRVVLKEYPIFGGASLVAAKAALAANLQGRYFDFHGALYEIEGRITEAAALKKAEEIGLDMARLRKDMESAPVAAALKETRDLADKLGIRGTPAFFVGDKLIPGAPENLVELLKDGADQVRKNGCRNC